MTTKHKILKPQVAEFIANPDDQDSLRLMEEALYESALWNEAKRLAGLKKMSVENFVDSLNKDEFRQLEGMARLAVVIAAPKVQGLSERVGVSASLRVEAGKLYRLAGEYDTFDEFLDAKVEQSQSLQSRGEAKFLRELLESLRASGQGKQIEKILSNKVVYGKLVASLATLRKKHGAVLANEAALRSIVEDLELQENRLAKERSEARMRGEKASVLDALSMEMKEIGAKKKKAIKDNEGVQERLEADLMATTSAAFELSSSPVARDVVASSLPSVARMKLEKMGYKPEEVSDDYRQEQKEKSKPEAKSIHLQGKTIFIIEIPSKDERFTSKMLGGMFDLRLAELDEAISYLSAMKKKGA